MKSVLLAAGAAISIFAAFVLGSEGSLPAGSSLGTQASLPTGSSLGAQASLPAGSSLGAQASLPAGSSLGAQASLPAGSSLGAQASLPAGSRQGLNDRSKQAGMPALPGAPALPLIFGGEKNMNSTGKKEVATLAGGCFWCLEAVYNDLRGVEKVVSGYSGGRVANPTYEQVCTGKTGHAEV